MATGWKKQGNGVRIYLSVLERPRGSLGKSGRCRRSSLSLDALYSDGFISTNKPTEVTATVGTNEFCGRCMPLLHVVVRALKALPDLNPRYRTITDVP